MDVHSSLQKERLQKLWFVSGATWHETCCFCCCCCCCCCWCCRVVIVVVLLLFDVAVVVGFVSLRLSKRLAKTSQLETDSFQPAAFCVCVSLILCDCVVVRYWCISAEVVVIIVEIVCYLLML